MKKLLTMVMAAVMAISAMGMTAFAAKNEEEVDFYNDVQVVTYDSETQEFHSEYLPREEVFPDAMPAMLPGYTFSFNQRITSGGTFLKNLDENINPYVFMLEDDDTMELNLDDDPKERLIFETYTSSGELKHGPRVLVTTQTTVIKGLRDYFNNGISEMYGTAGKCRISLSTTTEASTYVSGSVISY